MQSEDLCRIATALYAAAAQPDLQDTLYADSIRAEWNPKVEAFDRVAIVGVKRHRMIPSQSHNFVVRFYAGDPTDAASVRKKIANRIAGIGKEDRLRKKR